MRASSVKIPSSSPTLLPPGRKARRVGSLKKGFMGLLKKPGLRCLGLSRRSVGGTTDRFERPRFRARGFFNSPFISCFLGEMFSGPKRNGFRIGGYQDRPYDGGQNRPQFPPCEPSTFRNRRRGKPDTRRSPSIRTAEQLVSCTSSRKQEMNRKRYLTILCGLCYDWGASSSVFSKTRACWIKERKRQAPAVGCARRASSVYVPSAVVSPYRRR
jgi:hypothetical protein